VLVRIRVRRGRQTKGIGALIRRICAIKKAAEEENEEEPVEADQEV